MGKADYDIGNICSMFQVCSAVSSYRIIGAGHINDTFFVKMDSSSAHDYVLQRINEGVFRDVPALMENVARVTGHIRSKLSGVPLSDPDREVLTLIPAHDGRVYCQDGEGNFWRMYIFIRDSISHDIVRTPGQAYEGGRAFGRFQASLIDMPGGPLNETIPGFHNVDARLKAFYDKIGNDPCKRAAAVRDEIAFAEKRSEEMRRILELGAQGRIQLRITHNDTKFNNVLFDGNGRALCVIDLDTVMNGYVHYDFGDSIRTTASSAAEDENDLSRVYMDIRLFEAYAKGFLSEIGRCLSRDETENLAFSAKLMTFIIGLRFLTDYLDGDRYFRIHYPDQNLRRARAQFRLLSSMEQQYGEMRDIIERISRGLE